MTSERMAEVHAALSEIAILSVAIEDLDDYVAAVRGASPVVDANDHVALALAVAGVQQVASPLLGGDASTA